MVLDPETEQAGSEVQLPKAIDASGDVAGLPRDAGEAPEATGVIDVAGAVLDR